MYDRSAVLELLPPFRQSLKSASEWGTDGRREGERERERERERRGEREREGLKSEN